MGSWYTTTVSKWGRRVSRCPWNNKNERGSRFSFFFFFFSIKGQLKRRLDLIQNGTTTTGGCRRRRVALFSLSLSRPHAAAVRERFARVTLQFAASMTGHVTRVHRSAGPNDDGDPTVRDGSYNGEEEERKKERKEVARGAIEHPLPPYSHSFPLLFH